MHNYIYKNHNNSANTSAGVFFVCLVNPMEGKKGGFYKYLQLKNT